MKGRRCALAKASATIGDESVRMALPMDMKKLRAPQAISQEAIVVVVDSGA